MIFPPRFNGRKRGGLFSGRNGTFNGADGSFSRRWQDGAVDAGSPYLDGVLASTVFDLDATLAESYPGTGTTWANLVAAPADGSAQTDYDFTNQGLTFNGTAGNSAAYLSTAGAGQSQPTGGNTAFLNNLPKTTGGTSFWFAITFRFTGVGVQRLFTTGPDFAPAGSIAVNIGAAENILLGQRGDTSAATGNSSDLLVAGTDYIVIASHDSTNNLTSFWVSETVGQEVVHTFNATTSSALLFSLFSETDLGLPMASGTRIYSAAMGNEYLDDTKAAAIIAHLEARHGRDYTP